MKDDDETQRDEFPLHSVLQAIEFQKQRLMNNTSKRHDLFNTTEPEDDVEDI